MKNYFEIFSIPINFTINLDDLEKKYLNFQKQFHPDKSSLDDLSKSIEINEAYKILSDDFLRACYILKLNDIDILHDEKSVKVDFSTLEHVLELQEKIAEIKKDEIKNLETEINSEIKLLIADASKSNNIKEAAQILVKAKYLKKALQDLKNKRQKL